MGPTDHDQCPSPSRSQGAHQGREGQDDLLILYTALCRVRKGYNLYIWQKGLVFCADSNCVTGD